MPDLTGCPACRRAESTPLARALDAAAAAAALLLARPGPPDLFAGAADVIAVMAGGLPRRRRTWYARHRDAWVRTGDPAELARMVRHVT